MIKSQILFACNHYKNLTRKYISGKLKGWGGGGILSLQLSWEIPYFKIFVIESSSKYSNKQEHMTPGNKASAVVPKAP